MQKLKIRKDKYDENMGKAYIIIYHQCLPTLKNDREASDKFATIWRNQDVIAVLKLVQNLCFSYNAKTQGVMATVVSHKGLFTPYQKDGMDYHTYHCEFMAHVETIETYGGIGAVEVGPNFLANKIKGMANSGTILDAKKPMDTECALAISAMCEEYLAALMLSGAHQECFGDLQTDLKNQYGYGDECYPKMLAACLSLLNRWTPAITKSPHFPPCTPPITEQVKDEDKALVFVQDAKKDVKKPTSTSTVVDDTSSSKGH
jgi:hypothetical protein